MTLRTANLALLVAAGLCRFGMAARVADADKMVTLTTAARLYGLDLVREDLTQRHVLRGQGVHAIVCPGFHAAWVNGHIIPLSRPARLRREEVEVPRSFLEVLNAPPGNDQAAPDLPRPIRAGAPPRIVLDAGHGGRDSGAFRDYALAEKTLNLDIALRVKRLLEQHGCKVIMTRSTDVFVALPDRVRLANAAKPDLFVSIHANAMAQRRSPARGFETYFVDARSSTRRQGLARLGRQFRAQDYGAVSRGDALLGSVLCTALYEEYCMQSKLLAEYIQAGLSRYIQSKNRGTKNQSSLHVLRGVMCPRVLVEVGFLSNPRTGQLFRQHWYRERLAQGLADGILSFVRAQQTWRGERGK